MLHHVLHPLPLPAHETSAAHGAAGLAAADFPVSHGGAGDATTGAEVLTSGPGTMANLSPAQTAYYQALIEQQLAPLRLLLPWPWH